MKIFGIAKKNPYLTKLKKFNFKCKIEMKLTMYSRCGTKKGSSSRGKENH